MFSLLLSAAERYVTDTCPGAGIEVGRYSALMTSYADDVKLICKSAADLNRAYS